MGAQEVEVLAEHPVGAEERLDGHRRRHVRGLEEDREVFERQQQQREHAVGAVDEGEPLFGGELEGFEACALQGFPGRDGFTAFQHQAFTDQAQAYVGEGGEVAAGTHGAVLGNGGGEPGVQEVHQRVHQLRADARVAGGERPGPYRHHGPHDLGLDERPHSGGVAAKEGPLELQTIVGRYPRVRQRPEARRHPVDREGAVDHCLDAPARDAYTLPGLRAHLHPRPAPGHGDDGGRVELLYIRLLRPSREATRAPSVGAERYVGPIGASKDRSRIHPLNDVPLSHVGRVVYADPCSLAEGLWPLQRNLAGRGLDLRPRSI